MQCLPKSTPKSSNYGRISAITHNYSQKTMAKLINNIDSNLLTWWKYKLKYCRGKMQSSMNNTMKWRLSMTWYIMNQHILSLSLRIIWSWMISMNFLRDRIPQKSRPWDYRGSLITIRLIKVRSIQVMFLCCLQLISFWRIFKESRE